jgi:hypothetical protein
MHHTHRTPRQYDVSDDVTTLISLLAARLRDPSTVEFGITTSILDLIEEVARSERDRMGQALTDVVAASIDLVEEDDEDDEDEAEEESDPLPF